MILQLQQVHLRLPEFELAVELECRGHATAIMGPSGAGKTTLLEVIAGLRTPQTARIRLGETMLVDTGAGIFVSTQLRRVAYVPQDLALFPHLTVRGNILYGQRPEEKGTPVALSHVLDVLEIGGLIDRPIAGLSRGEQQRVALARAVMSRPRLLLLDEPMANLDRALKRQVMPFLRRLRDEFELPMLYVTHDPAEAAEMCGQVVMLERGRVAGVQ